MALSEGELFHQGTHEPKEAGFVGSKVGSNHGRYVPFFVVWDSFVCTKLWDLS